MPQYLSSWIDFSTPDRPSWALICRQAAGGVDQNIVKREGIYMTEANAKDFDERDRKRAFKFMDLPYDVRHDILAYICRHQTARVFLKGNYGLPTRVPLPAIACVRNRKLRAEARLVTMKQTTFEIHSGPGNAKFQEWLSAIDLSVSGETLLKTGFDAIQSLSFPYFSRFPHAVLEPTCPNNDIQLMLKCGNLREVTLDFVYSELMHADDTTGNYYVPKSIYTLRREYRLDSMLKLFAHGNLRTIILDGPRGQPRADFALQELAAWIRWEYALRANIAASLKKSMTNSAKVVDVLIV